MTWSLLLACRPPEPRPAPSGPCEGLSHVSFATGTTLAVEQPGCGTLRVDGFAPVGDGTFTVTLFSDGARVVPYVEAVGDAVLDSVIATGSFALEGDDGRVGWGLVEAAEVGRGPAEAPVRAAWAASYGAPDGASLLLGTLGGTTTTSRVEITESGFEVSWGSLDLPLAGGRGVYLDPLFTAVGRDARELWADWSLAVAVESGTPEPQVLPGGVEVPFARGGEVVAEALLAAPEAELVVLGAGWPDVPGDPVELLGSIRAAGRMAGIVASPFAVLPGGPVASDHPEWLVTTRSGEPLELDGWWTLDPSDPAAMAWVVASLQPLQGFDVLYLDELRAVAAPGVRDDAPLGTLALQLALDTLARSVRGTTLVAVDAPTLTVVGRVDGIRVGDGLVGDDRIHTLGAALPLAPVLALDPGALRLDGPGDPSGPLAAATLTGSVRIDLSVSPTPASLRGAAALWAAALPPAGLPEPGGDRWVRFEGPEHVVLVAPSDAPVTVDGPGGREILSGAVEPAGPRVLAPGAGEVWVR
jgi:hypothetical protein